MSAPDQTGLLNPDQINALVAEHDAPDATPERQQQIAQQFDADRAQRAQANYQAGIESAQSMFTDPKTLGGQWTPENSQTSKLLGSDEEADKKRFANIGWIAAQQGLPRDQVTDVYPMLRDKIARERFGKPEITDGEFFNTVQSNINDAKAKNDLLSKIATTSANTGLNDALEGKPADWAPHFQAMNATAAAFRPEGSPSFDNGEDWKTVQASYNRSYALATANKDLFTVARDVLNQDVGDNKLKTGETLDEAASRIAALSPQDKQSVFGMLTLFAKENGAKNPVDFIDKLSTFGGQTGKSFERGASSLATGAFGAASDLQLTKIKEELENGSPQIVGKDASLDNLLSVQAQSQAVGSFATGMPQALNIDGPVRDATEPERKALLAQVNAKIQTNQVLRELRNFAETNLDPIKPVLTGVIPNAAEKGLYMMAGSAPLMAEASIPGGLALSAVSMSGGAYDSLRVKYPDLDPTKAAMVAGVTGVAQAAAFKLPLQAMAGKLPFFSKAVSDLMTPTSNFWARAAIGTAAGTAEQTAMLTGINLIPAASQSVISALDKDVPQVDWKQQIGDAWKQTPETFWMALPMAMVGAGVMASNESGFVSKIIQDPDALQKFGIKPEDAQAIAQAHASGDAAGAEQQFRQAWQARTPAEIKAAGVAMQADLDHAKTMQESPEAPTLRTTADGGYQVLDKAGNVTLETRDESAALAAVTDRTTSDITGDHEAQAMNDLKAFFEEKDPNRRVELIKESKTLQDAIGENQATPEQVAERMRIAGAQAGDTASGFRVLGENVADIRENLFTDVSKIYQGGSVDTMIEERAHGDLKKALSDGSLSMEDALAAVKAWAEHHPEFAIPENATPTQQETALQEGVADMVKAKFFGNLKAIEGLPKSVMGFIARAVTYFKEVFKRAGTLKSLSDSGKLSGNFEDFLAKSVGLKDERNVSQATHEAAGEIAGVSFSTLSSADYTQRISDKIDALKRDPKERLKIYERASEKIQALKDKADKSLYPFALEVMGKEKAGRAEMLHAFATLDAVASTLPPEVRAKIGGSAYKMLAELKGNAARAKFVNEQLGKVDRALEGVLKKDYAGQIEGLIEKSHPVGGKGEKVKGKIGVEGHRAFKEIDRVSQLSGDDVQRELDGINQAYADTDPADTKAILALTEKAHYLEAFGDLKGKTADELASSFKLAKEIYEKGRSSWIAQEQSRLEQVKSLRGAIIDGAGKKGTDSELIASKDADSGLNGGSKGLLQRFRSFTQVLEVALGRDNAVTQRWHEADVKASRQKETALVDSHREFQELLKSIYGKKTSRLERGRALWDLRTERNIKVDKIEGRKVESVDIPIDTARDILDGKLEPEPFGIKEEDRADLKSAVDAWSSSDSRRESVTVDTVKSKGTTETVPLTAMEGVYLTQLAGQSRYAKALEKNGWTPEVMAKIEGMLPDEAKAIRSWMADNYAKGYEPLNRIFQSMHGIDLPREDGYAPARFKHDTAEATQSPYGGDVMFDGGMSTGFLRTRKNHSARPELADALTNYFQHVAATEHFKAYAEFAREMNGTMRSQDVRNSLEAAKGKSTLDPLLDWVKTINDGGLKAKSLGKELDNIARHLSGASAYLGLAWNLGTASKHLLSAFNAAAEMPLGAYAKGFAKLLAGQMEVGHIWNSDFIQNRLHGDWSPEQKAAMAKSWETAPSRRQLFLDLGTHILPFVDTVATTGGAAIAYDYHFNEAMKMPGMTKEQADSMAMHATEDMVYRTAYPASMTQRSLAEIGASPMGKLLWLFATPGRQKAGMFLTAVQHAMSGEGSKTELARVMFVTHVVGGLMAAGMSSAWRSAHDDQEDSFFNAHDWEPRDFAIAALAGPLAEMPLLRDLIAHLEGKPAHTAVGSAERGLDSVWKLVQSATGKLSKNEDANRNKDPWKWYMNKGADALNLVGFGMGNGMESLGVGARLINDRRKELEKLSGNTKPTGKRR
jgi:hypothetical protein